MPRCGATFDEDMGVALRAASLLDNKTFWVAAGTAPLTFSRLFSKKLPHRRRARVIQGRKCGLTVSSPVDLPECANNAGVDYAPLLCSGI